MDDIQTLKDLIDFDFSAIATPEHEAEVEEYERRQEEAERTRRFRATVPERYRDESLDTYRAADAWQETALEAARQFASEVRGGAFRTLIMLGGAGTGKTHLACGIIREAGGLYRMSGVIVDELRRAKSYTSEETEADIVDFYSSVRLLVVDEIGRGIYAQEEQYMLYQVINGRYNSRRPTVLISNQGKKDFLEYVGAAAIDRLTESARTLEFSGKSYRAGLRNAGQERPALP